MPTDGDSPTVKTTQTSLDILATIRDLDGARLMEIADELGVAKSTAHKHLATLEKNGYLLKEGDTYHIGLKFLNFGEYARNRWPGFDLITDAVAELTERTDEECDFVAEDHGRVTTIAESYHRWVKYEESNPGTPRRSTVRTSVRTTTCTRRRRGSQSSPRTRPHAWRR
ncbi:helix-turn-helix domain-containing protein [Haloarculaceae archaeon H-GB2-1]|nr:helix-turn-helix domain-containing protein [Haloarculaceae archaeon H-GB2-1]